MTVLTDQLGNDISGTTARRTAMAGRFEPGSLYYDTDLGVQLVWTGTAWQLADGSTALGDSGYGLHRLTWYKAQYDWAVDGGAIGTITPAKTVTLPVGFIIYGGLLEVLTAANASSAVPTIGVSSQGAGDLVAAAAYSGAPWSTTGIKALIPVMTAASAVQIATTAKQVKVVIAVSANLTALKFNVHIAGFLGGV